MNTSTVLFVALLLSVSGLLPRSAARAQMPDPPGQVAAGEQPRYEAYLALPKNRNKKSR